ncbi:hypothetical protein TTHERM_00655340 (macronuclear) [Tetrahymena thermophila SB210]|uniref:NlpC/P60 family protein n=1 Tax=Tetrahymena thermophila (strain SB210) TaxID=312017 RepID=Q22H18_TETTS|nr:hypothetical protein TTHERM_00655340 [Tetrahymena thermophila SB210]EAR84506.2 hypothetical protein TTHERM_00655340 [Tetrahymena thermophila SB210]|eukprot:XP_001032169.2 hypothetical protein TTHERM_00655340 [Tetrahymena thermophila SB210]
MRKVLIALAIITFCSALNLQNVLTKLGYQEETNYFGFKVLTKEFEDFVDTVLIDGFKTVFEDPSLYATFMKTISSFTLEDKKGAFIQCSKGSKPGFFKFLADQDGVVGPNGSETIVLTPKEGDCFDQVTVQYTKINDQSVELIFTSGNRRNDTADNCKESYVIGSTMNYYSLALGKPNKSHKWTLKNLKPQNIKSIEEFGLRVFKTCDKFSNILPDVLLSLGLSLGGLGLNPDIPFFGSKPSWWMEVLNPLFIQQATGYLWLRREDKYVDLDETEVHPGDLIIATRMDGLDQLIQWGTGSRSGHSVTLLEIDGELRTVESQDSTYWPKHGIQRNTWKDWKQWAKNAGFNVAVLPLSEENRKKFNNTAAVEYFLNLEGTPYGYSTFLYGWVDTENKSLPAILDVNFVYSALTLVEKFYPSIPKSIINEGLNHRLGTQDLNLVQLYEVMYQKNLTIAEVFAIPEQDSWLYSYGHSLVCSAFVAGVWRAGGLFGDLQINVSEFTPRDVYQMKFFDKNFKKPEKCHKDGLPYCQIMGKFVMDVITDGYNSITPYEHMNEHCPSQPPFYLRTQGC